MAKVFVSYAQKDRDVALPMIEAMRRANLSVWPPGKVTSDKDWGRQIRRALKSAKCMVYVWSKAAAQSKWVQQEIKTAIQAWASDRLVLATLDDTPLPVGLSDLSSISIRDVSGTKHLIERVQAMLSVQAKAASDRALRAERAPTKTRVWRWFVLAGIIGAVLLFLAFLARNWLKSRSQATNSPLPLPSPPPPPPEIYSSEAVLVFLIVILGAAIGAVAIWLWLRRPSPAAQASAPAPAAGITVTANDGLHVFVSYSRKDEQTVDQLVQQIQQLGYAVWIDRQSASRSIFRRSSSRWIRCRPVSRSHPN